MCGGAEQGCGIGGGTGTHAGTVKGGGKHPGTQGAEAQGAGPAKPAPSRVDAAKQGCGMGGGIAAHAHKHRGMQGAQPANPAGTPPSRTDAACKPGGGGAAVPRVPQTPAVLGHGAEAVEEAMHAAAAGAGATLSALSVPPPAPAEAPGMALLPGEAASVPMVAATVAVATVPMVNGAMFSGMAGWSAASGCPGACFSSAISSSFRARSGLVRSWPCRRIRRIRRCRPSRRSSRRCRPCRPILRSPNRGKWNRRPERGAKRVQRKFRSMAECTRRRRRAPLRRAGKPRG